MVLICGQSGEALINQCVLENLPVRTCFYSFINRYLLAVFITMHDMVPEETAQLLALAWLPGHLHIGQLGGSSHLHAQLRGQLLPGKLVRTKGIG